MIIAHLRTWAHAHRRLVTLLAALVAATVYGIADAPEAHAYTCPSTQTVNLNDGSASATLYVRRNCSDGRSRWSGTVRDIKCDARSAYLQMRFYSGPNRFPFRSEEPRAGNGCGTSSTFSYSSTNADPYRVWVCARAWNSGPTQSTGDCRNLY